MVTYIASFGLDGFLNYNKDYETGASSYLQKIKQKAHEIRMNGHQKIRPVIEKIKAKKAEIKAVEMSKLPQAEKDKKIATLKEELKPLKQEARKIRTENTKEFEAILTPEQKVKFENFKKEHKNRHHHNGCPKDKK